MRPESPRDMELQTSRGIWKKSSRSQEEGSMNSILLNLNTVKHICRLLNWWSFAIASVNHEYTYILSFKPQTIPESIASLLTHLIYNPSVIWIHEKKSILIERAQINI